MLFPYQPEIPIVERLRFLTDIFVGKNGQEQRVALRFAPRQEFDYTFLVEDRQRAEIENLLFGKLSVVYDLPIWSDAIVVTQPASVAATSVTTYNSLPSDLGWTALYNDFRVASKAFLYWDENTKEAVSSITISGPTIGFAGALINNYPVGSQIVPIRPALISDGQTKVSRYRKNITQYDITFRVVDNSVDYSSIGAFDTYIGLPILNDPNAVTNTLSESNNIKVFVNDGSTGLISSSTFWDRSKRTTIKTFETVTRQRKWEIRQLLHWLHGQQKVMLLPTFGTDVEITSDIAAVDTTLAVRNDGYTLYTQHRTPRAIIQVETLAGTKYNAKINTSAVFDVNTELLAINSAFGVSIPVVNIARTSVVEPVRLDSDDITITHNDGIGSATFILPVRTVFSTNTAEVGVGSTSDHSGSIPSDFVSGSSGSGPFLPTFYCGSTTLQGRIDHTANFDTFHITPIGTSTYKVWYIAGAYLLGDGNFKVAGYDIMFQPVALVSGVFTPVGSPTVLASAPGNSTEYNTIKAAEIANTGQNTFVTTTGHGYLGLRLQSAVSTIMWYGLQPKFQFCYHHAGSGSGVSEPPPSGSDGPISTGSGPSSGASSGSASGPLADCSCGIDGANVNISWNVHFTNGEEDVCRADTVLGDDTTFAPVGSGDSGLFVASVVSSGPDCDKYNITVYVHCTGDKWYYQIFLGGEGIEGCEGSIDGCQYDISYTGPSVEFHPTCGAGGCIEATISFSVTDGDGGPQSGTITISGC